MDDIQVYFGAGQKISIFNFERDDLPPLRMSSQLSRIVRFNGAGKGNSYLVNLALHQYLLSLNVGPDRDHQRAALLHDCSEMFMADIVRPVKRHVPDYVAIEERVIARFAKVFDVPLGAFEAIKDADTKISNDEKLFLFNQPCEHSDGGMSQEDYDKAKANRLGICIPPLDANASRWLWYTRFVDLFGE